MTSPICNEKDDSLFSVKALCTTSPSSPKYLAITKQYHLTGIQYQDSLPRPEYTPVLQPPTTTMAPIDNRNTRYHAISEYRPSMDEDDRDDERLLRSPIHAPTSPLPPKSYSASFHATLYFRIISCAFAIALIPIYDRLYLDSTHGNSPRIFAICCVTRQSFVVVQYLISRYIIRGTRIQIVISTAERTISGHEDTPKRSLVGPIFNVFSVVIDVAILLGLLIRSIIAAHDVLGSWFLNSDWTRNLGLRAVDAVVVASFAVAFHILSIVDLGRPCSVTTEIGYQKLKPNAGRFFCGIEFNDFDTKAPVEPPRRSRQSQADVEALIPSSESATVKGDGPA